MLNTRELQESLVAFDVTLPDGEQMSGLDFVTSEAWQTMRGNSAIPNGSLVLSHLDDPVAGDTLRELTGYREDNKQAWCAAANTLLLAGLVTVEPPLPEGVIITSENCDGLLFQRADIYSVRRTATRLAMPMIGWQDSLPIRVARDLLPSPTTA